VLAEAHLASGLDIFRLSLHVLGATVWIGGQIVVAGLLPTIRGFGDEAPGKVARALPKLLWPAFILLVVTGFWNVSAVGSPHGSGWDAVMGIKMLVVVGAGVAVWYHTKAKTAQARGISAGLGLVFSLVAMVLGVALAG
jgi:putative copper export protein